MYSIKKLIISSFLFCSIISQSAPVALDSTIEGIKLKDIIIESIQETQVSEELMMAVIRVESNYRNVVGDKHLSNRAYGLTQLRQPAIDTVNDMYGDCGIQKAHELENDIIGQMIYTARYLDYLMTIFEDEKHAIEAYNLGMTKVRKGNYNNFKYYHKIITAMNK